MRRAISHMSYKFVLLVTVVLCLASGFIWYKHAYATAPNQYNGYCGYVILGRQGCSGYFDGTDYYDTHSQAYYNQHPNDNAVPGDDILSPYQGSTDALPVNSAAQLESILGSYLNLTDNGTQYVYDGVDAAFLIDAMLGEPGNALCGTGNCTWQDGVNYAIANFAQWEADVNYYASQPAYQPGWDGWIDWNFTLALGSQDPDSTHVCNPRGGGGGCDFNTATTPESPAPSDWQEVAFRTGTVTQLPVAIVFHNPDGSKIVIKRNCANILGSVEGLAEPPAAVSCGNTTPSPNVIQPNGLFTMKIDDTYSGGSPPAYTAFQISIPDAVPAYVNNSAVPSNSGSDLSYTTASLRAPPSSGTYPVTWQLYNGASPVGPACSGQLVITNLPYFSVYGASVRAGGDFQPSCQTGSGTTGGTIASWYDNQTAYAGASTFFSAIALGQITGFGSAQSRGGPPNSRPAGLTFANSGPGSGNVTTSALLPQLGGNVGGNHCFYSPTAPNPGTASDIPDPPSAANIGIAPLDNGAHSYNSSVSGNLTLTGGTIASGNNLALYVTGDVYITPGATGGIVYSGTTGGWAINANNMSNIPSFVLVVTGGNIYIDPGVTELDGTYVAEKNGSGNGGTIYTCGIDSGGGNFVPYAKIGIYSKCNNQLTVYGSFVADQINLMRSYGTLSQANSNDSPNSALKSCSNGPSQSPVCAAEMFDFSPELYLSSPAIEPPNNGAKYFDAATNLPPVL